jgi:glucose-1-phosphate thymidylyltransferase
MKGLILAGGTGGRLRPTTLAINKHLLTIYDKPMIYYPLATLMAAGIRNLLLISDQKSLEFYKTLLGDGDSIGVSISYAIQEHATGISDAFTIGKDFIGSDKCALILGDNVFHGTGLGRQLMDLSELEGCHIFAHRVADPSNYGVVEFSPEGKSIKISEKPKFTSSSYAIPGLYFFDNKVVAYAKEVKPSLRGEKEITSLLNRYLEDKELEVTILQRGTTWLDTGTFNSLHDASTYVRLVEERQGYKIACIEEVAWRQGWITTKSLAKIATNLFPSQYGEYLKKISHEEID